MQMKRRFWGFLSIQLVKTIAGKTADVGEVRGELAPVWLQEEVDCSLSAGVTAVGTKASHRLCFDLTAQVSNPT